MVSATQDTGQSILLKKESPVSLDHVGRDETKHGISGPSYSEAWNSLNEKDRDLLTAEEIVALFQQLSSSDEKHKQDSLFRRGFAMAKPCLEGLQKLLEFAGPFVSLESAAGTAMGLINGSVSVSYSRFLVASYV